jgi:hypothetical protein
VRRRDGSRVSQNLNIGSRGGYQNRTVPLFKTEGVEKLKKWIKLTAVILIIVMGGAGCMSSESKVIEHLEEKYGEKFKVEDVDKASALFPSTSGKDKIFAYPEGKPEQIFVAGESQNTEGKIYDTYVLARWGEELEKSFEQKIKEQIPGNSEFKVYIRIADSKYDETMKEMSIYDYFQNVNTDAEVVLNLAVKTQDTPDLDRYKEGLFNLYQQIGDIGAEDYTLLAGFVDEKEDVTDYIRTSNVNNLPWENYGGNLYGFSVLYNGASKLNNPDDVENYYKVVKEN